LLVVRLIRSQQQMKSGALAAGCRKWNVWRTENAFALLYVRRKICFHLVVFGPVRLSGQQRTLMRFSQFQTKIGAVGKEAAEDTGVPKKRKRGGK
jgi:hypothetical protein